MKQTITVFDVQSMFELKRELDKLLKTNRIVSTIVDPRNGLSITVMVIHEPLK